MTAKTILQHVALNCKDKIKADIFFTKILDLKLQKTSSLTSYLSEQIFGTFEQVDVIVYSDGFTNFEIFLTEKEVKNYFEHVCIKVKNKKEFIIKCEDYGLKPFKIIKGKKRLLFVKDFSGNLFEIV